jgi:hypothetical protein
MLFMDSGVEHPIVLARRSLDGGVALCKKTIDDMADEVKERKVGLLIMDPLVEFHEVPENDNPTMKLVLGTFRTVAKRARCASIVVAHTGKPDKTSSRGSSGDMNAIRGAVSQTGVARVIATVFPAAKEDAKEWTLEGSHLQYVKVEVAKITLGKKPADPWWFKFQNVRVNEDDVGTLLPVTMNRKKPTTGSIDLAQILAAALARAGNPATVHSFAELGKVMTAPELASFPDVKNRSRTILEAFGGADECLTDHGKLKLTRRGGKAGLGFHLDVAPPAASTGEDK